MCGIVGCLKLANGVDWVTEQTNLIHYRGPDSQIVKSITPELVMGVARLAMTDPHPRSNQPMIDAETGNALSFNGEIYNFPEIRNTLQSQGILFETESDTEVLLKYLGKVGLSDLSELNGMYAFAFYSKLENKLYFSRDKLGKKPLYVSQDGPVIRWASTADSFKSTRNGNSISDESLFQYLSLGYLLDPATTQSNHIAVKPGEIVCIDISNSKSDSWNVDYPSIDQYKDFTENMDLRNLIGESVEDRISGHDNIAISLSGGVDSSIIAIEVAARVGKSQAFTARWSDSDKDRYNLDADVAKNVCSKLNINLEQVEMIKPADLSVELRNFLITIQEPNNNPSGVSMLRLYSRMAETGHRLALTGDGSDEIFGGYARHTAVSKVKNVLNLQNKELITSSFADVRDGKTSLFRRALATQISPDSPFSWLQWHWIFTPRESAYIFEEKFIESRVFNSLSQSVVNLSKSIRLNQPQSLMKRDHEIWLAMESNRKLDRISMNYSIEARSPFQDDRVIYWANSYMVQNRYRKLSKEILWKTYPELNELGVRRDKAGFTSPVGHWLRGNPNLVKESLDYLSRDTRFNKHGLDYYREAPQRGQYRELMQLWTLVVLSTWLQIEN
jgi:asparagine synthase (glutamine-hydrolysing)